MSSTVYDVIKSISELTLRVYGEDQKHLFHNALFAMFDSIEPHYVADAPEISIDIALNAADTEQLLAEFLSEALTHADRKKLSFFRVEFSELEERGLVARIIGRSVDHFTTEIKAVVYREVDIVEINDIFCAAIIFEI